MFGGARTSCSDKSKHRNNANYECNENTGFRWRLRPEFRECSDNKRYTEHPDLYECNDITKRWRLKKGTIAPPRTECPDNSKFKGDLLHYECNEGTGFNWVLKNKYKKERSPDYPKRPLSGYMLWAMKNREKFATNGKKPKDVVKDLGSAWRNLDDDTKARYNTTARENMAAYKESLESIEGSRYTIIDKPKRTRKVNPVMLNWKRNERTRLQAENPDLDKKSINNMVTANWHARKNAVDLS